MRSLKTIGITAALTGLIAIASPAYAATTIGTDITTSAIGIGTTSPYRSLSVGGSGVFDGGDVRSSTITATSSVTTADETVTGAFSQTGSSNLTTASYTKLFDSTDITIDPTSQSHTVFIGKLGQMTYTGSGGFDTVGHIIGTLGYTIMNAASQTANLLIGAEGKLENLAGTISSAVSVEAGLADNALNQTITTWTGVNAQISGNEGTIGNAIGLNVNQNANTGTINNLIGVKVESPTGTPAGNIVGFSMPDQTASGDTIGFYGQLNSGTGKYNIYNPGTATNYFGGKVGIGSVSPVANLQVANGSATTTVEFGSSGQSKGTCLKLYRTDGTPVYAYVAAGATTFTLSTTACASVTNF